MPEHKKMLTYIQTESNLLLFQVMNSLDYAQLERGVFNLHLDEFNPKSLIQEVVKLETINLEHKQIEVV